MAKVQQEGEEDEPQVVLTSPTFEIPPSNSSSSKTTQHYPAHPGLRSPGAEVNYHHQNQRKAGQGGDISPVSSRGPSGVEIVRLNSKAKLKKGKDRDDGGDIGVRNRGGGTRDKVVNDSVDE